MSNGVIITLIICGTIVLLTLINTVGQITATKKTSKAIKSLFDKEDK